MKTPTVTQDPLAEKEAPKKMEIVLATLPLPAKIDPASKGLKAPETAASQPNKVPPKEKLVIKKKQILVQSFLMCFSVLFFFFFQDL